MRMFEVVMGLRLSKALAVRTGDVAVAAAAGAAAATVAIVTLAGHFALLALPAAFKFRVR